MDAIKLAVPGVQKLTPYLPGKPISDLQRELGIDHVVKLASNENPLGPSPKALTAIKAALEELHLYPDGSGFALKTALAKKFGLDRNGITLGNGSNDVLELIARAFLGDGLSAVFSEHAFAVYPIVTQPLALLLSSRLRIRVRRGLAMATICLLCVPQSIRRPGSFSSQIPTTRRALIWVASN